ncbi:MAG TPA: GTP-binding protein, partial [Trueperaceae bacterium]|nr:GTP-binding protein [Trueperaceae bacterium]
MNIELSEATRSLVSKERQQLSELHSLILELDASESELESLKTALKDLDGIFMVVISGEYNAGKSSLVNALLGQKVMTEGVTPTTDRVTIISYGDEAKIIEESASLARREYPAEILKDLAFVDTPGTNAIIKEHQELTEHFIPRADLVLFVTSADRPFTESERKFLQLIASWGKKVLIVINKMDIIESEQERQKIVDFVKEHARATLGSSPSIFTLKAKQAFNAKQENDLEKIQDSGIDKLEHFIENSLASNSRIKLKLLNPLGVAERIAKDFSQIIDKRQSLLEDDKKTLSEVDRQLMQYEKDTERELNNHMARIKNILLEVEKRGEIFFDETIRTRNILNLMKTDRIKRDFESQVIKSVDKDIDLAISELVDWFLQRNLNLWEDMMGFVNQRRQAGNEKLIGEIGGRFQYDRDSLITKLKHNSEKVLENYDQDSEARKL